LNPIALVLLAVLVLVLLRPSSSARPRAPGYTAGQVAGALDSQLTAAAGHGADVEAVGLLTGLQGFAASPPAPAPRPYEGIGAGNTDQHLPGLTGAFGTDVRGTSTAFAAPSTLGYTPGQQDPAVLKAHADWALAHPGVPYPESSGPGGFASFIEGLDLKFLGAVSYGALPAVIGAGEAASYQPGITGTSDASAAASWAGGVAT